MRSDEHGATAVLVAGAMFFLFGAAALAVDVSIFQSSARTTQNIADFSCLGGVVEDSDSEKIDMAVEYTKQNWPEMADNGVFLSLSSTNATLTSGNHQVLYETSVDSDPDQMRVRVLESKNTNFAQALGAASVNVVQEALCRTDTSNSGGGGALPFGAITGGWSGPLQISPPCGPQNGNCGALFVPRDDVSGSGPTFIKNLAEGSDRLLQTWLGAQNQGGGNAAIDCDDVSAGDECHLIATDTGVSAGQLGEGFIQRLADDPNATRTFTHSGQTLNGDLPSDILGGTWTPLMDAFATTPSFWVESLLGEYNSTNTAKHYYFDGVVPANKCDSPRFANVPIVTEELDWDLGDDHEGWPSGNKTVKIVGMVDVIIEEPYDGDIKANKNLKTAGASVIWFGPNATCDEKPIGLTNGAPVGGSLKTTPKLVSG